MTRAAPSFELEPYTAQVVDFFNAIGLPTRIVEGASAFLERVRIVHGELEIDPGCSASNLLHEGGHLAVLPKAFRHLMTGNLDEGTKVMFDAIKDMNLEPDDPMMRNAIQASESEATAWAWAVGKHLGIPDALIIQDDEYEGEGASIRDMLSIKCHFGVNGLMHAGFCLNRPNPHRDLPIYPQLAFWLQE